METSLHRCHLHALHFRLSMPQARMQAAWVFVCYFFVWFWFVFWFFSLSPIMLCFFLQHSFLGLLESLCWILQIQSMNCHPHWLWTVVITLFLAKMHFDTSLLEPNTSLLESTILLSFKRLTSAHGISWFFPWAVLSWCLNTNTCQLVSTVQVRMAQAWQVLHLHTQTGAQTWAPCP